MKATIYHNPRCSKSRHTLQILEDHNIEIDVVDYQKTPLSVEKIDEICTGLGIKPQQIIRTKEQLFTDLGLSINAQKSRKEWLEILHSNPKLIERPIVQIDQKFVIGRPPENVEALLKSLS